MTKFKLLLALFFGLFAVSFSSLPALTDDITTQEPFKFIAATSIYQETQENNLLVIEISENELRFIFKDSLQELYHSVKISQSEILTDSLPENLLQLCQKPETHIVTLDNTKAFQGYFTDITLAELQEFIQKSPEKGLKAAQTLRDFMERFDISSIDCRTQEPGIPTDGTFIEWPETLASLHGLYLSGMTVSPVTGEIPSKGFVVAIAGQSRIIPAAVFFDDKESGRQIMKDYLLEKHRYFFQENTYLGLWHDPDSNLVFLDLSNIFENLDEAIQAGIERDQIAIFDLLTFTTIPTGGTGGVNDAANF